MFQCCTRSSNNTKFSQTLLVLVKKIYTENIHNVHSMCTSTCKKKTFIKADNYKRMNM